MTAARIPNTSDESPCLHDLFVAQVARTPDRVAVTDGRRSLTYEQLDRTSNRLASRLRALGVGPEVLVAVCVERDVGVVVAILAVLKAGGAYVPLDPRYPRARLEFVLDDCACPVVVGHRGFADLFSDTNAEFVDIADDIADEGDTAAAPDGGARPGNAAYVIHTSGSTGRPKGVVVSHANVTRLFTVLRGELGFGGDDTWTMFHSYAFDFAVWEMWGALLHGGRLVVVPYAMSRDPEAFWRLLVEQRVTVLSQTPSAFRQLLRAAEADGWPATSLRSVVFGGEALDPGMLVNWFDRYGDAAPRLVNMYGITETTVHVTIRPLTRADAGSTASPIGLPLADLTATVLDEDMRPVRVDGQPGELYVGGAGVARGYLGRPELTAERFRPDPDGPAGALRYRTGDLVMWHDGELEFLGRVDDQIQFRGFRVEPGEIEAALVAWPGVTAAAVVLREDHDGTEHLAGYVVAADGVELVRDAVRAELARQLPAHLVPTTIDVLDTLPLTVSGKLDRAALRDFTTRAAPSSTSDLSTADLSTRLATVLAEVLGVPSVAPDDNFFALGGDSMTAIRAVSLAREAGIPVSVQALFQHPTIAELTAAGRVAPIESAPAEPSGGVADTYPASLLQVGVIYECEVTDDPTLYHDLTAVRLSGLLDLAALRHALDAVSARHELLRVSFDLISQDEPSQILHREAPIPLSTLDLAGAGDPVEAVQAWWADQQLQPFTLTEAPLARCHVLRHPDGTFHLAVSVHHSVVDGWSFSVLMADLLRAYDHELGGGEPLDAPPTVSYRDFVALERHEVDDPDTERYWKSLLDIRPTTPLWTSDADAREESTVSVPVAAALAARVRQFCVRSGVPPKSAYLAAHLWTLAAVTGSPEVLTGVAVNGRPERAGAEQTVGMFVNTVPLPLRIPDGSWRSLVEKTFAAERDQLPYRRFPLAKLREHGVRPPEVLFNFADFRPFDALGRLHTIRTHDWWFGDRDQFPLAVTITRRPTSPEWDVVVRAGGDHGGATLAKTVSRLFLEVLEEIVEGPDQPVRQVSVLHP